MRLSLSLSLSLCLSLCLSRSLSPLRCACGIYLEKLFLKTRWAEWSRSVLHNPTILRIVILLLCLQAGSLLTTGMVMFCGSLYYQALTGDSTFTKAAPYGGSLLIFGWVAMAF
uniref:Uncharacterized protein n=1 Tax=Callorhinchus milii TaxID=7868 RepID=A0A4W3H543_CALMI